jgi:hypothetical protein
MEPGCLPRRGRSTAAEEDPRGTALSRRSSSRPRSNLLSCESDRVADYAQRNSTADALRETTARWSTPVATGRTHASLIGTGAVLIVSGAENDGCRDTQSHHNNTNPHDASSSGAPRLEVTPALRTVNRCGQPRSSDGRSTPARRRMRDVSTLLAVEAIINTSTVAALVMLYRELVLRPSI